MAATTGREGGGAGAGRQPAAASIRASAQTPTRSEQVFQQAGRALSPPEACSLARRSIKRLGVATVYRAVQEMAASGLLIPVALPGQGLRYEAAREDHHHFFHCDDCGKVYPATGCAADLDKLTPAGFQAVRHEVVLYGHCAMCQEAPKPRRKQARSERDRR